MRDRILVCIYVLLIALPGVAMLVGAPDRKVEGSLARTKRPALKIGSVINERYQHKLTKWFESSIAFKGYSMYVDNTILARGFGETKPDSHVVIGEDNVLFIREDLDGFNRTADQLPPQAAIDATATRIAELQRRMRAKNRVFLPVLIPSKTTVFRGEVPARWMRDLDDRAADRLYERVKAALDAHGAEYVDIAPLIEASDRALVWGDAARHWTPYAACMAVREALLRYAKHTGRSPSPMACTWVDKYKFPAHDDFDLYRLLNARFPVAKKRAPVVEHPAPTSAPKPALLTMGSSFCWHLIREASDSKIFSRIHMNYYNSTFVDWPGDGRTPVEPFTDSWRSIVYENDLYLVDMFETYMPLDTAMFDQLLQEVDAMPAR